MNNTYEEISKILVNDANKSKTYRIIYEDRSLELGDLINECYLYVIKKENIKIEEEVSNFLKESRRKSRQNSHLSLFDNYEYNTEEYEYYEQENKKIKKEILETMNLTDIEIMVLNYMANEEKYKNIKNNEKYHSLLRSDKRGVDRSRLCTQYESIIEKMKDFIVKNFDEII